MVKVMLPYKSGGGLPVVAVGGGDIWVSIKFQTTLALVTIKSVGFNYVMVILPYRYTWYLKQVMVSFQWYGELATRRIRIRIRRILMRRVSNSPYQRYVIAGSQLLINNIITNLNSESKRLQQLCNWYVPLKGGRDGSKEKGNLSYLFLLFLMGVQKNRPMHY
jgi:hypothetical protein